MQRVYDEIKSLGGEVIVITFATPVQLAAFAREASLPFLVVTDVERKAYRAFALGQTSLGGFLRFGVIWQYLKLIFLGWMPRKPAADADVWQLGGDFVLDPEGRLVYAYASKDATDRPSNDALLQAMRQGGLSRAS